MKIVFFLVLFFCICSVAFAGNEYIWVDTDGITHIERYRSNISVDSQGGTKVYTNEDLKKYEKKGHSSSSKVVLPAPDVKKSNKETSQNSISGPKRFGDVRIEVSGCKTLQDEIDFKRDGSGGAVAIVPGLGRTVSEICDVVGQACSTCQEVLLEKK